MGNRYIDINDNSIVGSGTSGSPYNYNQLVNYCNPSIIINGETAGASISTIGDTFHLKGKKTENFYQRAGMNSWVYIFIDMSVGDVREGNYQFVGWDIVTNGPPIIHTQLRDLILFGRGIDVVPNVTMYVTLSDMVVYNYYLTQADINFDISLLYMPEGSVNKTVMTLKNCHLVAEGIQNDFYPYENATVPRGNMFIYGCTLDAFLTFSEMINELWFIDCAFFTDGEPNLSYMGALIMNNNIAKYPGFTNAIHNIDFIGDVVPPLEEFNIWRIPYLETTEDCNTFFSDRLNIQYGEFLIPAPAGKQESFRITNDYNYGLYDEKRVTYGAYYFGTSGEPIPPIPPPVIPGGGHIGAFNFENSYSATEDVSISIDSPFINLSASDLTLTLETNIVVSFEVGAPIIQLSPPSDNALVQNYFDVSIISEPVVGSFPLIVNFSASNYEPQYYYDGDWEATEFQWWFDYAVTSGENDYVSCATDIATNIYYGDIGQTYDVRCVVIYSQI